MRKRESLLWLVLLLVSFGLMSGGCGGGGGGDSSDSAQGGQTPAEPPAQEVDFYSLSGTWVARDGAGTASGGGENLQIRLDGGAGVLQVLDVASTEATVEILSEIFWDVYSGSLQVNTIQVYDYVPTKYVLTRIGNNKFRSTFSTQSFPSRTIDFTVLTENTMYVEDAGIFNYYGIQYSFKGAYYMDKAQSTTRTTPTPVPDPTPTPGPDQDIKLGG